MNLAIVFLCLVLANYSFGSTLTQVEEKKAKWYELVRDPDLFPCAAYTPSKKSCDPDHDIAPAGDMVLFNSLLCYAGVDFSCSAVALSQEENGRFRRSPLHVNMPPTNGSGTFSKDQTMGLLLYLSVTKDKNVALEWWNWVTQYSGGGPIRVCEKKHCILPPSMFGILYHVWRHLGLSPSRKMRLLKSAANEEILLAQVGGKEGYELHLMAVNSLLYKVIDRPYIRLAQKISEKQSQNPFYLWLVGTPKEEIAGSLLSKCKVLDLKTYPQNSGHQWAWERDTEERAWQNSMGWDCIFLAELLIN